MSILKLREIQSSSMLENINSRNIRAKDAMIKPTYLKSEDHIDIILKKLINITFVQKLDTLLCRR